MKYYSKFTFLIPMVIGLLALNLSSCDKDDDNVPQATKGNLLISTAVVNSDGFSGSGYVQLIDNLEPQSITNTYAYPASVTHNPCVLGNDIYVLPGFGGETPLTKYTKTDGSLVKTGEYTLPEQSGASNAVIKGDYLYVSCQYLAKILVLKHTDMTYVKEIDLSSYGVGDQNPDPASMLIRDNLLYVGLYQTVGGYYPAPDRPYCDILIIDTDTDTHVKKITTTIAGISCPTKLGDPNSIFMDENNDIYILCGTTASLPGHTSGILRIKAGETEFDDSYYFDLSNTTIEGESNKLKHILYCKYHENAKLYATVYISAYSSEPANYLSDRTILPVEVDLKAKSLKTLGLPRGCAYAKTVEIYDDEVVFGLATDTDNGFYTYNIETGDASSSAVITTEGFPFAVRTLEN